MKSKFMKELLQDMEEYKEEVRDESSDRYQESTEDYARRTYAYSDFRSQLNGSISKEFEALEPCRWWQIFKRVRIKQIKSLWWKVDSSKPLVLRPEYKAPDKVKPTLEGFSKFLAKKHG